MPTGGFFAEAVLGRFNSAEKLDLSRFWNWQDSPIPLTLPKSHRWKRVCDRARRRQQSIRWVRRNCSNRRRWGCPSYLSQLASWPKLRARGQLPRHERHERPAATRRDRNDAGGTGRAISCRKPWIPSRPMAPGSMKARKSTTTRRPQRNRRLQTRGIARRRFGSVQWRSGGPGGAGASGPGPVEALRPRPENRPPHRRLSQASAREAFLGPQPANPTPAADEAAKPGLLSLLVSVLPPEPKTSPILDLSGRLDMQGPYAIEIPNGDWKIQVQGGVGSLALPGQRAARVPHWLVTSSSVRSGPAQWDAAPGIQVPGLPAGWLDDRLDDLRMRSSINTVPMNSVILPGGSGDLKSISTCACSCPAC